MGCKAVVVSGLLPQDSGKTYFTISLAKALRSLGYSVSVSKPVAAHSAWFQHTSLTESVALGIMVGEDVLNYLREGLIERVDEQNPIDILTAPPDIGIYPTITTYFKAISSSIVQAVLARISFYGRKYFVIEKNLSKVPKSLRMEIINLVKKIGNYESVTTEWLIDKLTSKELGNYINSLIRAMLSRSDYVLIESFNAAILPVLSLAEVVDSLIVVAPGRALIYGKYKVSNYLSGAVTTANLLSKELVNLLRPDLAFEVVPSDTGSGVIRNSDVRKIIELT